jgi:GNAT superfamily N-acetyltransferase
MNTAANAAEPLLTLARETAHFEGILALQRRNLRHSLSEAQQAQDGFVYVEHDLPLLTRMAEQSPQAIALADRSVVGYSLSMRPSMAEWLPALQPMFDQFDRMHWRGRRLGDFSYLVGGQVCVDPAWRGRGLIGALYACSRDAAGREVELCLTEIALRNVVSRRAHERIGFIEVGRYTDAHEDWSVVAWPWWDAR